MVVQHTVPWHCTVLYFTSLHCTGCGPYLCLEGGEGCGPVQGEAVLGWQHVEVHQVKVQVVAHLHGAVEHTRHAHTTHRHTTHRQGLLMALHVMSVWCEGRKEDKGYAHV